ncbi:MAG: hypothetical protein ACI9VR_001063 [Cognaticolwellia sp.]|jgi:hypothetical protein
MLFALFFACSGGDPAPVTPAPAAPVAAAAPAEMSCADKLASYSGRFAKGDKLTAKNALAVSEDELRLVRNEIFARYGRGFVSEDLQAHFETQSWYCVDPGFEDSRLSKTDRDNVALLKSFEGDNSAALQEHGNLQTEFDQWGISLQTDDRCEVVDLSDMYNAESASRYWDSRGEWIVTWDGQEKFELGKVQSAAAFKINVKTGDILEHVAL